MCVFTVEVCTLRVNQKVQFLDQNINAYVIVLDIVKFASEVFVSVYFCQKLMRVPTSSQT